MAPRTNRPAAAVSGLLAPSAQFALGPMYDTHLVEVYGEVDDADEHGKRKRVDEPPMSKGFTMIAVVEIA